MKKVCKAGLAILLMMTLAACQAEERDIDTIVKETMKTTLTAPIPDFTNLDKDYYRFYLPNDIGRRSSDEVSNILIFENNYLIMCVNAPNVIKDFFYGTISQTEEAVETKMLESSQIQNYKGTYIDYGNKTVDYEVLVATIENGYYYLQLTSRHLSFGAVVNKQGLGAMLTKMLDIAKTVRINYELLATDFSNREASTSALQALDLFRERKPSSGYIIDLLNPNTMPEEKTTEDEESTGN